MQGIIFTFYCTIYQVERVNVSGSMAAWLNLPCYILKVAFK